MYLANNNPKIRTLIEIWLSDSISVLYIHDLEEESRKIGISKTEYAFDEYYIPCNSIEKSLGINCEIWNYSKVYDKSLQVVNMSNENK